MDGSEKSKGNLMSQEALVPRYLLDAVSTCLPMGFSIVSADGIIISPS